MTDLSTIFEHAQSVGTWTAAGLFAVDRVPVWLATWLNYRKLSAEDRYAMNKGYNEQIALLKRQNRRLMRRVAELESKARENEKL